MRQTSALLFLIKLLKIPVSLYSYSLIATLFGVSLAKDQWLLAYSIIIVLDLAVWGPVNDIFRSKFVTVKEKFGEQIALKQSQSLLFYIFTFSALIVTFVMLRPDIISHILVSDYSEVQMQSLNTMIQVVAPILLINQATLIGISILNAYDIFYIPELATFFTQIISILILLLSAKYLGIYSLILSTFISLIILLLFIVVKIKQQKISLFTSFKPQFSDFKQYFIFALPLFIPYLIGQINTVVEKRLISKQGVGSISIIDFGKKFPDMVNAVVSSVLLTVLIPVLARAFVKKDEADFSKNFNQIFSLGILGLGFFVVFMFFSSSDLMNFFYGNSDISKESMNKILQLNIFYSFAIIGVFMYVIFGMSMLAIGKNKLNAFAGSVTQIFVITSNIFLIDQFGIIIFPLSILIAHILSSLYMFCYYPYSKYDVVKTFAKNVFMLLIVLVLMKFILPLVLNQLPSDSSILFRLAIASVLQLIIFIIVGSLLNLEEFISALIIVKKRLGVK
ncbi:lipid II flippase MurJ [Sphingobacterium faecium]|uniref:lipid II flippase MurJ n=1 Tax=Sphingobacterium faecium TaxID=34087 RepID=UPI00129265F6|nr:lipid II flippase MurJ [Sphingobacterium faecium]